MVKKLPKKNSTLRIAIELIGSQKEVAKLCGIKQSSVSNWLRRSKKIPSRHVLTIERATEGKVKRWQLRPDLYPPEEYEEDE